MCSTQRGLYFSGNNEEKNIKRSRRSRSNLVSGSEFDFLEFFLYTKSIFNMPGIFWTSLLSFSLL